METWRILNFIGETIIHILVWYKISSAKFWILVSNQNHFHLVFWNAYVLFTNLKEGRGKLWAGQTSVVSLDCSLVIPFELMSSENLGFELPMGSE